MPACSKENIPPS